MKQLMIGDYMLKKFKIAIPIVMAAATFSTASLANVLGNFYKDKTITITIPYGPGGTYDKYGSSFSNHLGKEISGNPTIIMQYMPGAGGSRAMNWFANVAPRNGYNLLVPLDNSIVNQLLRPKKMKYNANDFTWLGASNQTNSVICIRSDSGVKTVADMKRIKTIASVTGPASSTFLFISLASGLLDWKVQIVAGYKGSSRAMFAVEQGETQMTAPNWLAWGSKVPHWFVGKKPFARCILQNGYQKDPALPNVPMLPDLLNERDKPLALFLASAGPLGRGLVLPPGAPRRLVAPLRAAYDRMNNSKKFVGELKKRKLRLIPTGGAAMQKLVAEIIKSASPAVIKRAKKIIFRKR
jgi:tripartite-type tricarboxylate transporter receptor subunit TctC